MCFQCVKNAFASIVGLYIQFYNDLIDGIGVDRMNKSLFLNQCILSNHLPPSDTRHYTSQETRIWEVTRIFDALRAYRKLDPPAIHPEAGLRQWMVLGLLENPSFA